MPGHPMSLRVHIVCVPQPLRGVGSGRFLRPENQATDRRKNARLVRQDWWVGQQHIWTHSAPSALVSPAGRCDGFTRRAVRPSKRLKTRWRYPWRARRFCAIEYARTAPGQPSRTARAAAQTEHLELDNAAVWIFLFARPKYDRTRRNYDQPPHQS